MLIEFSYLFENEENKNLLKILIVKVRQEFTILFLQLFFCFAELRLERNSGHRECP